MPLHCPFCHAPEEERVEGEDYENKKRKVLLVMFDCPFHYTFSVEQATTEEEMQLFLNEWRSSEEGEKWLEGVGPIMRARELENIASYESGKPINNNNQKLKS